MSAYELKTDAGLKAACQTAALKASPEWHRELKARWNVCVLLVRNSGCRLFETFDY